MLKIVVAITGASGAIYGRQLLRRLTTLRDQIAELSLVMTPNAAQVWKMELGDQSWSDYPVRRFEPQDFHAPFASGSAKYDAMIIIPCSMGTLGRIAAGVSGDLITRAADVMLKERKKLICVIRETPYNLVHIRNMETVMLAGGIICPASPSFYSMPKTLEELADTVVNRVIDLSGLEITGFRWGAGHQPR